MQEGLDSSLDRPGMAVNGGLRARVHKEMVVRGWAKGQMSVIIVGDQDMWQGIVDSQGGSRASAHLWSATIVRVEDIWPGIAALRG